LKNKQKKKEKKKKKKKKKKRESSSKKTCGRLSQKISEKGGEGEEYYSGSDQVRRSWQGLGNE